MNQKDFGEIIKSIEEAVRTKKKEEKEKEKEKKKIKKFLKKLSKTSMRKITFESGISMRREEDDWKLYKITTGEEEYIGLIEYMDPERLSEIVKQLKKIKTVE